MAIQSGNVDNRDVQEMYGYLEARIEILKRRIAELERENEGLLRTIHSERLLFNTGGDDELNH
jgi:hypothetical protein